MATGKSPQPAIGARPEPVPGLDAEQLPMTRVRPREEAEGEQAVQRAPTRAERTPVEPVETAQVVNFADRAEEIRTTIRSMKSACRQ